MKKLNTIVVALILLCGCAPPSLITGTYLQEDRPTNQYDSLFVAVLIDNIHARSTFENQFEDELESKGIAVSKSKNVFPPNFTQDLLDRNTLLDSIRKTQAEGIVTISVMDEETQSRYIAQTGPYNPLAYYGYYENFWAYYTYNTPILYQSGYYVEDKVYYLEINLYDVETEKLVWSAQTRTYDPPNSSTFSRQLADKMVNEMIEKNLIKSKKGS